MAELTVPYILTLAAADAVNPCALAVLTLVLVAILTKYPKERHKVLTVGLSFTLAVFVLYYIYGLLIINVFKMAVEVMSVYSIWIYKGLGVVALVLGALNIKDYWSYGAGGFVMEVPRKWRPSMKGLISKVTSAWGAFVIGAFVSVFLLPCTVGPYVVAGGILSTMDLLATMPWLFLYNLVFVLPMVAITIAVYAGFTTVHQASGWREENIQRLHLVAGAIMVIIGLALVTGLIA